MKDLSNEKIAIAPDVIETIVSIAVSEVEGVVSMEQTSVSAGIKSLFASQKQSSNIEVGSDEDGLMHIGVHIEVKEGYAFPELAAKVRQAVADAMATQLGLPVGSVDVFIDSVLFED